MRCETFNYRSMWYKAGPMPEAGPELVTSRLDRYVGEGTCSLCLEKIRVDLNAKDLHQTLCKLEHAFLDHVKEKHSN